MRRAVETALPGRCYERTRSLEQGRPLTPVDWKAGDELQRGASPQVYLISNFEGSVPIAPLMGEFVGFEHGRTSVGPSSSGSHDPAPTPEQAAHQVVGSVKWRVDHVAHAQRELEAATSANDPVRWRSAKAELDQAIARAHESFARSTDRVAAASDADRTELEHARAKLVTTEQLASTVVPPLGYVLVAEEAELLARIREGGEIKPVLEQMTSADLRLVRDRISRHLANDILAEAIWSLGPDRRDRVRELVSDVDRTKTRARADAVRATRHPPPSTKLESLDDRLISALDSFAPESALFNALQPASTAERHVLGARVRGYRPGNGDTFAARFTALLEPTRMRVLAFLDGRFAPAKEVPHDLTDRFYGAVEKIGPDYSYEAPAAETAGRIANRAEDYLYLNANRAWPDLRTYAVGIVWPELGDNIVWRSQGVFATRLVDALHEQMHNLNRTEVLAIFYPHDLFALIDRLRPDHDLTDWIPAVGLALGQIAQRVAAASLVRLAPRIAAAPDLAQESVAISHPMDRFVFEALRKPGAIEVAPMAHPSASATTRAIRLTWQNEPAAWNWVRAEPGDATAEEVAAQLSRETGRDDLFAATIAVAPPMFGIPAAWARHVPTAAARMPQGPAEADTPELRLLSLARHGLAPEENQHISPEHARVLRTDIADQLASIHGMLVPWGFGAFATEAIERLPGEHDGVLTGQRSRLGTFGAAVASIDRQRSGDKPRKESPLRSIVKQIAGAIATSHVAASDSLYASALHAQSELAIDALQGQILDAAVTTGVPIAQRPMPLAADPAVSRNAIAAEQAIASARVTQDRLINGGDVAGPELFDATLATREAALHSRIDAMFKETGQLQVGATDADEGLSGWFAAGFSERFMTLKDVTTALRFHLDRVRNAWTQSLSAKTSEGDWSTTTDVAIRRAALEAATSEYATIRDDKELMQLLQDGPRLIRNQQLRRAVVNIVGMLAIAVVSGGVGAMVEEGIGGAMMTVEGAEAVGELSTSARLAAQASKVATGIVSNAIGQTAMDGTPIGRSLADNMLFAAGGHLVGKLWSGETLAAARAATRAFDVAAEEAGIIETRITAITDAEWAALGGLTGKVARVSGETLLNTALADVAARLEGLPQAGPHDASELFIQALSVAAGHSVHTALSERMPGLHQLANRQNAGVAERALLADANQLNELALALAQGRATKIEYAHAIFEERTRLLERELQLVSAHKDPSAHVELHRQLEASRNDALVAMRMNLIGLEELIPGHAWRGTEAELDRAITELSISHRVAKARDNARDVTVLTIDERLFEVHIRAAEPAPSKTRSAHELSTDLEMVPGSSLRGSKPGSVPDASKFEALRRIAIEAMPRVVNEADVNGIAHLDSNRFVVDLRDGTLTVIDVTIVRLPDHDVARLIPNSSRDSAVGGRTAHGEHTIQLSADLSADQVERALAHAVARLSAAHTRAKKGSFANGRGGDLAADTLGRLAELRVLVAQLESHPEAAATTRREITALADDLGVVGSHERLEELAAHLGAAERNALERAGRDRATLAEVREAAREDIRNDQERERQRGNVRPSQYDLAPGQKLGREDLARFATQAAHLRALESSHTLAALRAKAATLKPGEYVAYKDVQIGGGAALSARTPSSLLVDQRGRWQADASRDIAQTAQQLQELYKAHFADVRQVAAPNERVPLDAIRFWEDSIAAMGPVVDGVGTPRFEKGKFLLDITPSDGSETVTIEMTGTPVTAPGFVPEAVPGAPRVDILEVMTTLEKRLETVIELPTVTEEVRGAATAALRRLRAIDHPRATERGINDAFSGPARASLEHAMRENGAGDVDAALSAAKSGSDWADLLANDNLDSVSQIAFGDEANLELKVTRMLERLEQSRPNKNRRLRFVFAGAGGTAVSAAEIILGRRNTEVMMIGRENPAGLIGNPQFHKMALRHADGELAEMLHMKPGDGRLKMFLDKGVTFSPPTRHEDAEGRQTFEALPSRPDHPGEFVGDAYVVSAGRVQQTPPAISDLILQVVRANGAVSYRIDFDADRQFAGYTVRLTPKGGSTREIRITGAASRYLPLEALRAKGQISDEDYALVQRASGSRDTDSSDVPSASGGFPGGFAGSSVQASRKPVSQGEN